jgi:hypothetical protein
MALHGDGQFFLRQTISRKEREEENRGKNLHAHQPLDTSQRTSSVFPAV